MVKRILAGLTILLLLFTAVPMALKYIGPSANVVSVSKNMEMVKSAVYQEDKRAVSDGTFIQWWLAREWDDARWKKEFQVLKEAGMHYLVLTPTAFYSSEGNSGRGITRTIYPTKINGYSTMKREDGSGYPDVVELCLKNAQEAGFKVFLGLNFSEEWWENRRNADWIYARMEEGNKIADELWARYHDKYPDAFYGWYWCWEVDNIYFKRIDPYNSASILSNALKIQTGHLEATDRRLPIMLAPYMNWMLGTPKGYAMLWEYVFANSGLQAGDVFCPQDSIGAGGLNMKNLAAWFAELRKAVDKKPGIELWVDTEVFDVSDWTGVTVGRFVKQMEGVSPYVDNYVSFAYSHYYSPNVVHPGFHAAYLDYVKNGHLEDVPPTAPSGFQVEKAPDGTAYLKWEPSTDNEGICGYYVYRDGKRIANLQVPRTYTETVKTAETRYTDDLKGVKEEDKEAVFKYEVQAYDFAGNVSEKAGARIALADLN